MVLFGFYDSKWYNLQVLKSLKNYINNIEASKSKKLMT
jgi:hypothetical protein